MSAYSTNALADLIRSSAAAQAAALAAGEVSSRELTQAHLDRIGYAGWIGCEYKPRTDTVNGLGWRDSLTQQQ